MNVIHMPVLFLAPKAVPLIMLLLSGQLSAGDDPGMPGGDPDLPNAPLDAGIYVLFLVLLIYGMYKIRSRNATGN
jgi:hypothetical protein